MPNGLALQPTFIRVYYIFSCFSSFHCCSTRIYHCLLTRRCVVSLTREHVVTSSVFCVKASFLTRPLTVGRVQRMSYSFFAIKIIKSLEVYLKSYVMSENRKLGRKYSQEMKLEPSLLIFIKPAIHFCHLMAHVLHGRLILTSTHLSLIILLNINCPSINKLQYSLRGWKLLDDEGNPTFCEPGSLLQRSEEPRTAPCISHPHTVSVILWIFFLTLFLSSNGLLLSGVSTKMSEAFIIFPCLLRVPLMSSPMIWSLISSRPALYFRSSLPYV